MSRSKKSEETRSLILTTAFKLFMENGYENTSLQDIISQLGGLTKGAIYHHFKSKDEILIAVVDEMCNTKVDLMIAIRDDTTLNGREKLERMFSCSYQDSAQESLFAITPKLIDNPSFLTYYIKTVLYSTVPDFVVPVIRQGVADGSIKTDYPDELAEMLMFLCNIWMNPAIMHMSDDVLMHKALLVHDIAVSFGVTLYDDDMLHLIEKYRSISNTQ